MKRLLSIMCLMVSVASVALIILGVFLRFVETFNGNYVFGFDQGRDILAAKSIAYDHKLTLIGSEAGAGFAGLPGIFHGPGYYYILAIILLLSFGNPYGSIVFLCILSLAVLYALYWLTRKIFGDKVARGALVLSAVSLPLSAQGRMIWAPNFSGIIALPFLFSLWESRKKTLVSLFMTSFLASCLYHFEIPMAVPAIIAVCIYFMFVLRIRDIYRWAVIIFGVFIGFFPMILFESRHGWGVIKGLLSYGNRVAVGSQTKPFVLLNELTGDGNALLSTIRESFMFGVPWLQQIVPLILLGCAVFYVYSEKKKDVKQYVIALLVLIFSHFLVYVPYRGPVYSHYFSLLYFVYPLLGAYIVVRALDGRITRWVAFGLGLLLLGNVFGKFPKVISYDYKDDGGVAKIRGKTDAIDFIYADASGAAFNLYVFTPPVYTYAYDYILMWHAQKKYGYLPGKSMDKTVYLLIEPDPEKPWSYNGWLETVIKQGTVVSSWKLPSGFIVEKRLIGKDK